MSVHSAVGLDVPTACFVRQDAPLVLKNGGSVLKDGGSVLKNKKLENEDPDAVRAAN